MERGFSPHHRIFGELSFASRTASISIIPAREAWSADFSPHHRVFAGLSFDSRTPSIP
jgi:hypothetical protein